jgi:hypothetical protein
MDEDCFIKVTNADIFKEIKLLRDDINVIKTKTKISQWCSITALTLVSGMVIGMVLK